MVVIDTTKMKKKKRLEKELVAIAKAKNLRSKEVRGALTTVRQVLEDNVGELILFGERDPNTENYHYFKNFQLAIIEELKPEDLNPEPCRSVFNCPCYWMDLPLGRYTYYRDDGSSVRVAANGPIKPIRMRWEHDNKRKLKDIAIGEGDFTYKIDNHFILTVSSGLRLFDNSYRPSGIPHLEVLIRRDLIESVIDTEIKPPNYYLGNSRSYLLKMNALGLEPSEDISKKVFVECFRRIVRSNINYKVKENVEELKDMGFDKADFEVEAFPGIRVNPHQFLDGLENNPKYFTDY